MKTAVVGSGAIGGYLAAMLCHAGHAVTACVRTPFDRLVLETGERTMRVDVTIVDDPSRMQAVEWIVLATKAQDTESAAPWLERLTGTGSRVLVAQNGVEQVEQVAPLIDGATVVPSVVYVAAERTRPGHVVHHGASRMIVPASEDGNAVRRLFAGSALEVAESGDFRTAAWKKLLANSAANPLTTLTMRRMEVFSERPVIELARALLAETVVVARAEGAALDASDIEDTLRLYAGTPADGGSSMLYDRLAGHSLEYEYLTGAILRAAERHDIGVPLNRAVYALLRAIDNGLHTGVATD